MAMFAFKKKVKAHLCSLYLYSVLQNLPKHCGDHLDMRVHSISRLPINRPWSLPVHLRMPTASMLRATKQRLHAGLATKAIFLCLPRNRKKSLICLKGKL